QTRLHLRGYRCLGAQALRRQKSRRLRHLRARTPAHEAKEADLPPPPTATHKTAHASRSTQLAGTSSVPTAATPLSTPTPAPPTHRQPPPTQPSQAVPRPSTPPAAPPHRPNADRQRPSSPQLHHPAPARGSGI